MKDDEEFKKALADKQVPILVLDEKWHRLFAVHGKPDEIHETENELNALLARQGKLNEELKQLKKVKKQLMESIVANMDGTTSEDMDARDIFTKKYVSIKRNPMILMPGSIRFVWI